MTDNPEFNPEKAEQNKREGMAKARRSTDPYVWQCYMESQRFVAEQNFWYSADDIEKQRQRQFPDVVLKPHRKALGNMLQEGAKLGWCIKTADHFPSKQVQNNSRAQRLWQSNIYKGNRPNVPPRRRPRRPLRNDPREPELDL